MARPRKNPDMAPPPEVQPSLPEEPAQDAPVQEKAPTQAQDKEQEAPRMVSIRTPRASFWRCGLEFGHKPRIVNLDDLSADQVARLLSEPNLQVTEL